MAHQPQHKLPFQIHALSASSFLAFGQYSGQASGSVMAIFVLALAAAEAAVGLAIGLYLYRRNGTIDVEQFHFLRG